MAFSRWTSSWFNFTQKYAVWLIVLIIALGILFGFYTARNLSFHTNTEDMISEKLPWRQDYIQLKTQFPDSYKTIVIVVKGKTFEQTQQASLLLYEALKKEAAFQSVYAFNLSSFFNQEHLLYLNEKSLDGLLYRLPTIAPLLTLQANDLNQYLTLITQSLDRTTFLKEVEPFFNDLTTTLKSNQTGQDHYVTYAPLFTPKDAKPAPTYQIIEVKPKISYQTLTPGKEIIALIHSTFEHLNLAQDYHVSLQLTGEIVLNYEELKSVSFGASYAALGAFFLVLMLLMISFRSLKLVIIATITLILGLIITASFATFAIGHLNMISVAFAVLYIGLSIDFSIHLILHLMENRNLYKSKTKVILITFQDLAPSLTLCALSTCIGFYAFIPTTFQGVSELGLIAGTGMLISLFLNFSFLPAALSFITFPQSQPHSHISTFSKLSHIPFDYSKTVISAFLVLFALASISLAYVHFNADPMDIRDPKQPSVITFKNLDNQLEYGLAPVTLLLRNLNETKKIEADLSQLNEVNKVLTLESFIPDNQEKKKERIKKIKKILEIPQKATPLPETVQARIQSLEILNKKIATLKPTPSREALQIALRDYLKFLEPLSMNDKKEHLDDLSHSMLSGLSYQVQSLKKSLTPDIITKNNLPDSLIKRWHNPPFYRLDIFPRKHLNEEQEKEFVKQILNTYPHATGLPIIHQKAGEAVVLAFQEAFFIALIFIILLMLLAKRSLKEIVLTLIPLLGACLFTATATVLLNLDFNFANIIALPLLLGMGIDSGIHLVHRYVNQNEVRNLLATSTSKAVMVSTLTTLFSFMNLGFSSHLGMKSLGILLSIGMLSILICTLILLPAILKWIKTKRDDL